MCPQCSHVRTCSADSAADIQLAQSAPYRLVAPAAGLPLPDSMPWAPAATNENVWLELTHMAVVCECNHACQLYIHRQMQCQPDVQLFAIMLEQDGGRGPYCAHSALVARRGQ